MEQRQFKRIYFLQGVSVDADGEHYDTHCLDISLRGILLARPDHAPWRKGRRLLLRSPWHQSSILLCSVLWFIWTMRWPVVYVKPPTLTV